MSNAGGALTPRATAELVEFGEAEAYADMFAAAPPELGAGVMRLAGAMALTMAAAPIPLFNRVIGLGLRAPADDTQVHAYLTHFQAVGCQEFAIQVSPAATPGLEARLTALGLRQTGRWAKCLCRPTAEVKAPTHLRIEQIGPAQAGAYAQVVLAAFGMPLFLGSWLTGLVNRPDWRHYLAYDGEAAVAAGSLFVRAGVGWLGVGGTHPDHRRRGGQGALMARRIRDSAALGCEWVITETGEDTPSRPNPSFHNMRRTGFELAYLRPNYSPAPTSRSMYAWL